MVLGFGSRSSKRKSKIGADGAQVVRVSPSLPEMKSQGLSWPTNLVDVTAIRAASTPAPAAAASTPNAAKVSFSASDAGSAFPYNLPSRRASASQSKAPSIVNGNGEIRVPPPGHGRPPGGIASLYMSQPPSAFLARSVERSGTPHSTRTRHSHSQRKKAAPTFNLMVAGAQGTGKSSLLRLLIDTADISPTATSKQCASMDQFLRNSGKRTNRIETASIEILESRFDRILLSVIDTPGLDFQEGHELRLERQVSNIMKYLDLQYADTMDEEAKVTRKSKSDQHVHLCIYLINPDSVVTPSYRRVMSSLFTHSAISVDKDAAADKPQEERMSMDPADIRVIRRLSERVNVLPIIARADVLTDEKLAAVRKAVRRDLNDAKLTFGVFGPIKVEEDARDSNRESSTTASIDSNNPSSQSDEGIGAEESDDEIDNTAAITADRESAIGTDERRARPVIKLNPKHRAPTRSNSRSRLGLTERGSSLEDKRAPIPLSDLAAPGIDGETTLAAVRFSAGWLAGHAPREMGDAMPLAVVMPETPAGGSLRVRARALKPTVVAPLRPVSAYSVESSRPGSVYARSPGTQSVIESHTGYLPIASPASNTGTGAEMQSLNGEAGVVEKSSGEKDEEDEEDRGTPTPTASVRRAPSVDHFPLPTPTHAPPYGNGFGHSHTHSHSHGPSHFNMHYEPRDLRGVFVRRFRWGCVDVLNPEHCDFAALRTTVLSTHLKMLKLNTKEVLYEKYRTEKLLARRATRNISDEDRKRLLQDLGL